MGVSEWQNLATTGDVKRLLRWVILSARNQSMSTREAAVFSQLALALLKTCQESDFDERLTALEELLHAQHAQPNGTASTH